MAGIGITPAIAFVKKLILSDKKRFMYIDYSVQRDEDITFRNKLYNWPKLYSNIVITIRDTSKQGHIVENDIINFLARYPDADFFICGPTGYEKTVTSILKKINVLSEKIHLEKFTHAGGNSEMVH